MMNECTTSTTTWAELTARLGENYPKLRPILNSLVGELADLPIELVSLPYGARLIEDGQFVWGLSDILRSWKEAYDPSPVPLGLVLSKSVELYDLHPERRYTIPLHMLQAGDFFGLFENLCPGFMQQPHLQAAAGGTTLVTLPYIGTVEETRAFANWHGLGLHEQDYEDHLKANKKSRFQFGSFFADLLQAPSVGEDRAPPVDWRVELALFPKAAVEAIQANPVANGAILAFTLEQMQLSLGRAETAVEILSYPDPRNTGHTLAVRMIAQGLRPGFSPVFGCETDNLVLPAADLHARVLHTAAALPGGPCFPVVFRPSLKGEKPFYFLNWYYSNDDVRTSAKTLVGSVVTLAQKFEKEGAGRQIALAGLGTQSQLLQALEAARAVRAPNAPSVQLPKRSYFVEGGLVHIHP